MPKKIAIILLNYKDYAEKYLNDCINSLRKQDYAGGIRIFIVDNETSEKSYNYLKQNAPEAEIIRNEKNDGFAKGNNDAIKIALAGGFDYIVLFNLDTVIEKNCVSEMVKAAELTTQSQPCQGSRNEVGAVQARLMLWPEKEKVNSIGNAIHFLGFGYCEGNGEKYYNNPSRPPCQGGSEICYPSGAAVLFRAAALKKIGLFDEEFWMYNEDEDIGWRFWLAGYKCVLAPNAVACHKYEFSRSVKKFYWLERNRLLCIFKNYKLRTLILILPALLIMEIGLFIFSLKSGWFREKIRVYKYFFSPASWRYILKTRKEAQALRKAKDRDIIKMFSGKIMYQEINSGPLAFANIIFNIYWKIIRLFIVW
jgi:GT2 family glycosyltransferase